MRIISSVIAVLSTLSMLACVGGGGGGGGGGSPAIASGSTCTPSVQGETCGLHEGNSAHLKCDGTTLSSVQVCPAGTYCTSASGVYVCASTGGGSGDATTTDGASTTDSGAVSGDGGGNAKDTSIGGGDATVEVGPPLDIKQPPDTIVTKDADPPKACNGACTAAQKCNASTNKCYTPCGGPCASGKTCDESDGPPGVCLGGSSTGGSWGTDGNSSGVQKITSIAIAASGAGCDLTGDGVPDNSFAALASILGSQLGTAVEDGSLVILFDPKAWKTNGTAFQDASLATNKASKRNQSQNALFWDSSLGSDARNHCRFGIKIERHRIGIRQRAIDGHVLLQQHTNQRLGLRLATDRGKRFVGSGIDGGHQVRFGHCAAQHTVFGGLPLSCRADLAFDGDFGDGDC